MHELHSDSANLQNSAMLTSAHSFLCNAWLPTCMGAIAMACYLSPQNAECMTIHYIHAALQSTHGLLQLQLWSRAAS